MQFELATSGHDAATLAAALRPLDADAKLTLDAAAGRLEVFASASEAQVIEALRGVGCLARPAQKSLHISGGSTCCGHCG